MDATRRLPAGGNADTDRFLNLLGFRNALAGNRYSASVVVVLLAALLRSALPVLGFPFLFFLPALMGIAFALGRGPGFLATGLSTLLAAFLFVDPPASFALSDRDWLATILFAGIGVGVVTTCDLLAATLVERSADLAALTRSRTALAESDAFLRSVLASSTDCIKVLDLDGRLTFMTEGGQAVMEVSDFNQIAGCPWPDFWKGHGNTEAIAAVADARAGKTASFIGHADTMAGNSRWWHVAVSPIPGPDGRPERILSVSRDITALRESQAQRDRYARIVENSSDAIGMTLLDGSVFFLNEAGCRLVGLTQADLAQVRVTDFFPPEQIEAIATEIYPAVERDGSWTGERLFRHFKTGEIIPVLTTVFPIQDAEGELIGFGSVTRDIREQKRAEERQAIVNAEIAHRLKNTLAMVQSIAGMTLRKVLPPQELARFDERLQALARAHDLLHRGQWGAGDLSELASSVLENLGVRERCRQSGPPVRLGARAALSTSLLLHELATNAIKYGAMSVPTGSVDLAWHVEDAPGGRELVLCWSEQGGPPAMAPTRKGFGSRLLSLGLAGTGGAELRYEQAGLTAIFRARTEVLERA